MRKTIFITIIFTLLSLGLVGAISQEELNDAKSIIDSKADCKNLSDAQLEIIGEYYMEQMHPGETHALMHKMMGLEEGSDAEREFHINMAERLYCNDGVGGMMGGMMSMMEGRAGNAPSGYSYWGFWNPLFLAGAVILAIWLIHEAVTRKNSLSGSPMSILERRFENGEITKKQLEEMRKVIKGG